LGVKSGPGSGMPLIQGRHVPLCETAGAVSIAVMSFLDHVSMRSGGRSVDWATNPGSHMRVPDSMLRWRFCGCDGVAWDLVRFFFVVVVANVSDGGVCGGIVVNDDGVGVAWDVGVGKGVDDEFVDFGGVPVDVRWDRRESGGSERGFCLNLLNTGEDGAMGVAGSVEMAASAIEVDGTCMGSLDVKNEVVGEGLEDEIGGDGAGAIGVFGVYEEMNVA